MKRWNGWGEESVDAHLAPSAQQLLVKLVGTGSPQRSCPLEQAIATVPTSRLANHPLVSTEPEDRLRHARGQSLPDWVALRSGHIETFPDGVAHPSDRSELERVLSFAREVDARIIPHGGGTSVVGHLTPRPDGQAVLAVSMARLSTLTHFEEQNRLVTFGAGITGPDLEALLRARGFTLGHFPQSFEYSTLGGWVVTRSAGQQSLGYGRIEDLFAGGIMLTPAGRLVMPAQPASAAGPDLRQLVLGSEGRIGILSEVTVRVRRLPEVERFHAVFFPDWERAESAVRELSQADLSLSMMRLSNGMETQTNLALAGKEKLVRYLKRFLKLRKVRDEGCMLLMGFTGVKALVRLNRSRALDICKNQRGVHVFKPLGRAWNRNRFRAPYLRNTLWDLGYAVDTLETCVHWDAVTPAMAAMEKALRTALEPMGEKVHVFSHLSHFYTSGACVYTTYLFRIAPTPEETLKRWSLLKSAAGDAIVAHGGTISHQHGVGEDHRPWLHHEKTPLGIETLKRLFSHFDPKGIMNPGKLIG